MGLVASDGQLVTLSRFLDLHNEKLHTIKVELINVRLSLLDCSERAATPAGIALAEDPAGACDEEAKATPAESVRPAAEIPADVILRRTISKSNSFNCCIFF